MVIFGSANGNIELLIMVDGFGLWVFGSFKDFFFFSFIVEIHENIVVFHRLITLVWILTVCT